MGQKLKRNLPIILFAIIFLAGAGLMLYPVIGDYINRYTSSVTIASYEDTVDKLSKEQLKEMKSLAKSYNKQLAGKLDSKKEIDFEQVLNVEGIMAYIEIPKIHIYLPIFHDNTEENLTQGVTHVEDSSVPIGGKSTHTVLAGHTGLPSANLLTDIDQLVEGDDIYIHVLGEILCYEIDQIIVVLPEDIQYTQIEKGKDYITLVTCTPYGINDHRLLIRGKQVPYLGGASSAQDIREEVKVMSPVIFTGAGVGVLAVITLITTLVKRRKRKFLTQGKEKKDEENKK